MTRLKRTHLQRAIRISNIFVCILAVILVIPSQSLSTFASGVYTASTTDVNGNTLLASNTVNETATYDTSKDSSADTLKQLGVDPNWQNGVTRRNSALQFDGVDDRVTITNTGNVIGSSDETLSLWFNSQSYATNKYIFAQLASDGDTNRIVAQVDNTTRISVIAGSTTKILTTSALTNHWYHLVMVLDRTRGVAYVYLDGVRISGDITYAPSGSASDIMLGSGNLTANSRQFQGFIDDVRVYKRVLTADEIAKLYARNSISEANLTLHLKLDDGVGTTALDSSPYGNNGALKNGYNNAATGGAANGSSVGPVWTSGANAVADGFKGCSPEDTACVIPSGQAGSGNITVSADSSTTSKAAYDLQVTNAPALSFDGVDDYAPITTFPSTTLYSKLSYSFWFTTTNASPSGGASLFRSHTTQAVEASLIAGKIRFVHGFSTTGGVFDSAAVISANTWYHVVIAYDNASTSNLPTIYINGSAVSVTASTSPVGTAVDNWGGSGMGIAGTSASQRFSGSIDDVRAYSRLISSQEALSLYRGSTISGLNLLGWWKLDEGSGQVVADSSGNGYAGTLGVASTSGSDDPTWVEGVSFGAANGQTTPANSPAWLLGRYSDRQQIQITNSSGSVMQPGYAVNSPVTMSSLLNLNQTRADGNDYRIVYQPNDSVRSLSFDGSDDLITVPYNSNFDFGINQDFSASVWVKLPATQTNTAQTYNYIALRQYQGSLQTSFYLRVNNQTAGSPGLVSAGRFDNNGHSPSVTSNTAINDTKWHLVTLSRSGGSSGLMSLYIDGAFQNSTSDAATLSTTSNANLCWGADCTNGRWLTGSLDDARLFNRGLSATEVVALYNGGSGTPNQAVSGIVGWWRFDEGAGEIVADSSGNGLHAYLGASSNANSDDPTWNSTVTSTTPAGSGTADGVVSTGYEVPRYIPQGNALQLNGTTQSVQQSSIALPGGDTTFETWLNPSASVASTLFLRNTVLGINLLANRRIDIYTGTGTAWRGDNCSTSSGDAIPLNQWTHLAVTFSGSTGKIYFNGVLKKTCTMGGSIIGAAKPSYIGSTQGSSSFFAGSLAEIRISSSVRYNGTFTPQTSVFAADTKTVALWHFDESSGTSVNDFSGNGYTATLNGSPTWISNQGPLPSTQSAYFGMVTPLASGSTSSAYYVYYNNLTETSSALTTAPVSKTGVLFDGVDDTITGTQSNLPTGAAARTLSFWVKPTSLPSSGNKMAIATYAAGSTESSSVVLRNNGGTQQVCFGAGSTLTCANATLSITTASLVTVTYNGTTAILYVNGSSVGSASATVNTGINASTFYLGSASASDYFAGVIDGGRVYARTLSAAEVANLYLNTPAVSNENLVAWWKLDDASGTSAISSAGSGNTGTLTNMSFDNTSGWILNPNLLQLSSISVTSGRGVEVSSPRYFRYLARTTPTPSASPSWSAFLPMTGSPTQLGATGVKVSFNMNGLYGRYDVYTLASWVGEATSSTRSKTRGMPSVLNIVASGATNGTGTVDLINAATNTLWMRIPATSTNGNSVVGNNTPLSVAAMNGKLYIGLNSNATGQLRVVDFATDTVYQATSAGFKLFSGTIASRADEAQSYTTIPNSAVAPVIDSITGLSTQVVSSKQYVAVSGSGTNQGLYVIGDATAISGANYSSATITKFSRAASPVDAYTKVRLTSAGLLYGANNTQGGVDRWDSLTSGDQLGSVTRSYLAIGATTGASSIAVLRSGTVNALSVASSGSVVESGSNQVAIGTNSGAAIIDEHSTIGSSQVRYISRVGTVGSSGWSSKGFGTVLSFDNVDDRAMIPTSTTLDPGTNDFTVEAWVNSSCSSNCIIVQRRLGSTGAGYILQFTGSTTLSATYSDGTNAVTAQSSGAVSSGWHHVAAVRQGVSVSLYIDGQLQQTTTGSALGSISTTSNLNIGSNNTPANFMNGQIDEVRISNTARYTTTFSPAIQEFATDASTKGLWHFNALDGQNQTLIDTSSNANNGTLGATSSVASDDPLIVSPSFDGSADKVTAIRDYAASDRGSYLNFAANTYVNFAASASAAQTIGASNNLTTSLWVKNSTSSTIQQTFFDTKNATSTSTGGFNLMINANNGGVPSFTTGNGSAINTVSATKAVNDGQWHMITGVIDRTNSQQLIYVDGVLSNTTSFTNTWNLNSGGSMCIGGRSNSTSGGGCAATTHIGFIDDVRVYTRTLSATEISGLYNAGSGSSTIDRNLVNYWSFNGTSQTVTDTMANADGTLGSTSSSEASDPTRSIGSPVGEKGVIWVGTSSGSNTGALTAINASTLRQVSSYTTSNSLIPGNDISALNTSDGAMALVGTTSYGAWNPGRTGIVSMDTITGAVPQIVDVRVKQGAVRIKPGTTRVK